MNPSLVLVVLVLLNRTTYHDLGLPLLHSSRMLMGPSSSRSIEDQYSHGSPEHGPQEVYSQTQPANEITDPSLANGRLRVQGRLQGVPIDFVTLNPGNSSQLRKPRTAYSG